jgi:AGZA family xanthine/uracil permease-like MFS transporter
MNRYAWARWGDINAFFGLMLDNVAVMILLAAFVTGANPVADQLFTREFVLTQMIPGTALGVLVGDLVYTWLAFRLARRTNRSDVTAMPLGLDTPSTFAVGPLVLLPALKLGLTDFELPHDQAMVFAWHVGALVLVLIGVFKTMVAPLGEAVRRWVPRAGLLGSLAAIALGLISFMPLWLHIAAAPVVGMVSLTIILVTLIAHRQLPGKFPGALAAVLVGLVVFGIGKILTQEQIVPVVPLPPESPDIAWRLPNFLPDFAQDALWWRRVGVTALANLPVMLPFALATVIGGIDCTESAAAAGDEYDTRTILLTEGLASVLAGLCGGVIQNTPYIGQPAYKAMGGRAAYTLATALFIGALGVFGWFAHVFELLPEAALFPILVFVGLEITAQSFKATPVRHYAAIAFAALPALAYLALIGVEMTLAGRAPPAFAAASMQALVTLANGFIVTSLLWGSALAAIIDGKLRGAAAYLGVAGLCSLVGIIHSPLRPAAIAWPHEVYAQMPDADAIRCQSPFHWAAAYGLCAIMLVLLSLFRAPEKEGTTAHA